MNRKALRLWVEIRKLGALISRNVGRISNDGILSAWRFEADSQPERAGVLRSNSATSPSNVDASSPDMPPGFVGDVYLKLNPDLLAAGVDAVDHYRSYGQFEARKYALPAIDVVRSVRFEPSMRTVLLVSHEASRTGAPILALNLARVLSEEFNVVVLLLGGGVLLQFFEATGATVLIVPAARSSSFVADFAVSRICENFDIRFALVNSIESQRVLPALAQNFVPAVSLIHEFASYTRPKDAFVNAFLWSGKVVFSANVVKDNALSTFQQLGSSAVYVLPQGKCELPGLQASAASEEREVAFLRATMRSESRSDVTVVLGAGFVQFRKGVDLFIGCASQVARRAGQRRFRFVWIGDGYDPDLDVGYSAYLQDQVERAGLAADVVFLPETSAIEAAYQEADLFLLSSRLDPLPNVAIDAMSRGLPVLCFEKTTGIADFLVGIGLGPRCVARYLDIDDIASKILDFASSSALTADAGMKCSAAATGYFNMTHYVKQLDLLAQDARSRTLKEAVDCRTIHEASVLDPGCFADCAGDTSAESLVRRYVRAWASGTKRVKPFPGFHPGLYLERHGLAASDVDPLADYLRAGRPHGVWNYTVVMSEKGSRMSSTVQTRIALHIHVDGVESIRQILNRLAVSQHEPDLFITVASEEAHDVAKLLLKDYGSAVHLRSAGCGSHDFGCLFTTRNDVVGRPYGLIGHVHARTSDAPVSQCLHQGLSFLMDDMLGNQSFGMLDAIVQAFNQDSALGMLFPDSPDLPEISPYIESGDAYHGDSDVRKSFEHYLCPVDANFWIRPCVLDAVADRLRIDDFAVRERWSDDGKLMDAMSQRIALDVSAQSWKIATSNISGRW